MVHSWITPRIHAASIFDRCDFKSLSKCCLLINKLITWSETEATRLYMVSPKLTEIDMEFAQLPRSGNQYAQLFKTYLGLRWHNTEEFRQLVLAFLLTANGLESYPGLLDFLPEPNPNMTKKSVTKDIAEFRNFFRVKLGAAPKM
jgi:hypothetical protein